MAFSSLFTGLSAIKEDEKEPEEPLRARRKRQRQGQHTGPQNKKQHNHDQFTTLFKAPPDGSKAAHSNVPSAESCRAGAGFNRGRQHHCSDRAAQYKTVNTKNGNKQQEWKEKKQWQKNPYHQRGRGRPVGRGGRQLGRPGPRSGPGEWKYRNDRKDFQVNRILSMTDEFKEQNVLSVNGRLICRHFLWGRCFKGDDCQLEHVEGCNDFIKQVCKFYVQGLCSRGASCPYMHQSFPCKYFHTKGRCSKEGACLFSHEPLNDTTKELLDKFLLREQEMKELAKKTEQKALGLPGSADESEATEADKQPDILLLPVRPDFYKSSDTNAEETEELSDNKLEAVTPSPSDSAPVCSEASTSPQRQEPVCYSVEAVLGTQLCKPFANYFSTPRSQESGTLSSPGYPAASSSVSTLLTACKSVGNSTLNPPAQSASYVPISRSYLSLNSGIQNQKASESRSQESSLKLTPGLDSQICPSLASASGEKKKQGGNMPQSLRSAPGAPHEVSVSIPRDTSLLGKKESFTPSDLPDQRNTFSRPPSETFSSKHLPFLIPASKASWKPVGPSKGSTEVRHKAAADPVSRPLCHGVKAKPPADIRKKPSASEGDTKQQCPSDAVAESSSRKACCGESAVVCKKPPEIPFRSLFAALITHTPQPLVSSATCSSPVSQSAESRRAPPKAAPVKASTRPFLSLFSAPLAAAAALPHSQPGPDNTSPASRSQQPAGKATHFSDSKRKADSGTALPPQAASEVLQTSDEPGATLPPDPAVKPVANERQPPESPSHQGGGRAGSAAEATADSVLKTLFLRLSPLREGQISDASEGEQMQHEEKKQKGKKKPKDHSSHKAAPSSPGTKGAQVKDSGSHNLPFQPGLKLASQEGQGVNGSGAGSSLKDLFKNLDSSVSPFQH